jgi:LacI family transcriptional regulator
MTQAPEKKPVTLADIARAAGTSPSTASRAISGRGYVAADVRDRLLEAADRLGYVPNASARTLKHRTSRVIGVVVSDLGNPFYARLAAGIEQTLREVDYQMVILGDNSDGDEEVAAARTFLAMRAPGVILTPVGTAATRLLRSHGVAVVEVDRLLANVPCDAVVTDNEGGARDATELLLELGHRRIALLGVATTWTTDAGRLKGYRAALKSHRVAYDKNLVLRFPVHDGNAQARIGRLLDEEAPTAVFAANNQLAQQAWFALRERGLHIPGDVSLVAFDDVPWMEMVEPGITAVAQPTFAIGRRAAQLLLRRLDEPDLEPAVERLEPSLLVRGSTGTAP